MLAQSNPQLLADLNYTQYSAKALTTLITMLNSLPEGNTVLEFILNNLHHASNVTASLVNGTIVPTITHLLPNIASIPNIIVKTCSTAGVYMFQHIETGQIYIGSSCNLAIRAAGHLSQFSGALQPFPFHIEVNKLGGYSSVLWSSVYTTFSFTAVFENLHPGVWLSKGELQILQAFTQFLPRLLEQSLFTRFTPSLNSSLVVYFDFVKFDTHLLTVYDYALNGAKPVDIFNFLTGEHIRRVASISAASLFLYGSNDRRHIIRRSLGALSGITWTASNAITPRVMVTSPGVPLSNLVINHRPSSIKGPLSLPGIDLNSLPAPFIYIYDLEFNLIDQYLSYSSAIMALSPLLTYGLTNKPAERYSRCLQRACNLNKTANTEKGKVYVARHPSMINRKQST